MHRMVSQGLGRPDLDNGMGGAEAALSALAAKLVKPQGAQVGGARTARLGNVTCMSPAHITDLTASGPRYIYYEFSRLNINWKKTV